MDSFITLCNLYKPEGIGRYIMLDIESSRIIPFIKRGIGALYELCAPSSTPHSSLLIPR